MCCIPYFFRYQHPLNSHYCPVLWRYYCARISNIKDCVGVKLSSTYSETDGLACVANTDESCIKDQSTGQSDVCMLCIFRKHIDKGIVALSQHYTWLKESFQFNMWH